MTREDWEAQLALSINTLKAMDEEVEIVHDTGQSARLDKAVAELIATLSAEGPFLASSEDSTDQAYAHAAVAYQTQIAPIIPSASGVRYPL